jgi:hypothetical protein
VLTDGLDRARLSPLVPRLLVEADLGLEPHGLHSFPEM